ncbi:MAG: ferredoxin--NADP reductase [Winogradskyella sp.]|nr:ferredoxin--NADP reductase [Winogradskyella sp.]
MLNFNTLNIKSIQRETDSAIKLTFEVPEALRSAYQFKAGQYVTLKTTLDGIEIRRDYSICSSVSSGDLCVAIKAVSDGTFSVYANEHLKENDRLEVSEPNGRFVFEANAEKTRTIAAFAAGSGITPVLSILKTLLEDEPFSNFILVYGNRSLKDTMFLNQLTDLKNQYGNRLHLHFIFSRAQEDDAMFGRIEKSTVNLIVKNKYAQTAIERFYLCGPEEMIDVVKTTLQDNGVKPNNINYELFTTSATSDDATNNPEKEGISSVKVIVDDEEFSFSMQQKHSILEAALKQDIDAPYSCQGGICSSCVARLTEGTATMRQNNILTDGEVEEGLVLTCQAHPTSASIVVDYDDV